ALALERLRLAGHAPEKLRASPRNICSPLFSGARDQRPLNLKYGPSPFSCAFCSKKSGAPRLEAPRETCIASAIQDNPEK
ncbi:hypothetical protein, partial [Myxococcus sp. AM010]|uniref:hypothetical protein n=1 Tax=Myxococcus sp. AM010 TaxID=2745138 RepID=UPI001C3D85A7